jgi:phosphate transport system substrate-binding protein
MRMLPLTLVMLGLIGPANADTLRAGGLGATVKLLPILAAGFGDKQVSAVEVIPNLGSSGGLRALAGGALDVAVSGRPLKEEELSQGLRVAVIMRTPFVMVGSQENPDGLKSAEIAELFRGERSTWTDGSPVRVILRPKSDSDTPILGAMFPGMASAIEAARKRHDVTVAATDQDNADAAERIPGSLTGFTLTQFKTERRPLHLLPIDGVAPSLEALESGAYPFSKTIYFVLPAKTNPRAEDFVAFLRSPAGRAILRDSGNLIIPDPGKS